MPFDGPALSVTGVHKCFRIYAGSAGRLVEWASLGHLRRHNQHWALRDVSFSVARGETFGIIGRNGAGKTTLLALLANLLRPTSGSLVAEGNVAALINLGAGFDPDATGRENIGRITSLVGNQQPMNSDEIAAVLDFAELGEAADRPFRTYSAGMQLRLGFAVAVARRPDVLLVDEVLAVGDFFFRQRCYAKIAEMVALGTAVVLVSHDFNEVAQLCSRALWLEGGAIAALGPAKVVVTEYLRGGRRAQAGESTVIKSDVVPIGHVSDKNINFISAIPWPNPSQFEMLNDKSRALGGSILVQSLAICDSGMQSSRIFEHGEQLRVCIEFEALRAIDVPVVTLLITDQRGFLVHGSSNYQLGSEVPYHIGLGERLRCVIDIELSLAFGEYGLDLGFGEFSSRDFAARASMDFRDFGARLIHFGKLHGVAVVTVKPCATARPVMLAHHGLVGLPGAISTQFMSQDR